MRNVVIGIYVIVMGLLGYALGPGAGSSSIADESQVELEVDPSVETPRPEDALITNGEARDFRSMILELWMGSDPAKEKRLLILIAQWCEADPETAIEKLKELERAWDENVDARGVSLGYWIYETGRPFATRAWARIDREAAEESRAIVKDELLRMDAMLDPDAIEDYLASNPADADSVRELTRTFARERTQDAMRVVVEQGAFSRELIREVADVLVERDPQAALDWVKDSFSGHEESNATVAVIEAWARLDPEAALEFAATTDHFQHALREFASQDYREAFRWLQEYSSEKGGASYVTAAAVASQISDAPLEEVISLFSEIFPGYAVEGSDTPFAIELSASFAGQLGAVTQAMRSSGWPGAKAEAVATDLTGQPRSGLRDALLGLALHRLAETDAGGAIEVMKNVTASTGIEAAGTWVNPDVFGANLDAGFQFAELLPSDERTDWLAKFVEDGGKHAPEKLAAALAASPSFATNPDIVRTLAESWAKNDPVASAGWINGLSSSEARDAGIVAVLPELARESPEAAFTQAQSIDDASRRLQSLSAVAAQWVIENPDAATNAIRNAEMSDPEKVTILETMAERQGEGEGEAL